ncbi:MAG: hypothetical protein IPM29_15070 [Planctomycetes bacterium]|nr:hypothetical protein [Planctomycetota bacterium]
MLEIEGYLLVDAQDSPRRPELQVSDPVLALLAGAAKDAVLQAVVAEYHGPLGSRAQGLNIFFPVREEDWRSSNVSEVEFAADTSRDELPCASLSWVVPTAIDAAQPGPPTCTPGPFCDGIRFPFSAATGASAVLCVYDIASRLVHSVPVGSVDHAVSDGRDEAGARLPAGVWLYELDLGDSRGRAHQILLLR